MPTFDALAAYQSPPVFDVGPVNQLAGPRPAPAPSFPDPRPMNPGQPPGMFNFFSGQSHPWFQKFLTNHPNFLQNHPRLAQMFQGGSGGIVPPHMNPSPVPQFQHQGPGSGLAPMNPTPPRPMNPGGVLDMQRTRPNPLIAR